jgi:hypothetical protein
MPRPLWRVTTALFAFTLAHTAFAQNPPPETAPAPRPVVGEVRPELRERLKLDPFYQKHADLEGLPILSSEKVSDAGLAEARYFYCVRDVR